MHIPFKIRIEHIPKGNIGFESPRHSFVRIFSNTLIAPFRYPPKLTYSKDYLAGIHSCGCLAKDVISILSQSGAAIIKGMPIDNNDVLLMLARKFGAISTSGIEFAEHPLEDGAVFLVKVCSGGDGIKDEEGLPIFSTTKNEFCCHTDGYHRRETIDIVLLLCVQSDPIGGISGVTHIEDLLPALTSNELMLLKSRVFPTKHGPDSILNVAGDEHWVRFNLAEVERSLGNSNAELIVPHLEAARRLGALAQGQHMRWRFLLEPGDCLVLNNRRVLHGRTSLPQNSRRLLKRVWVSLD